MSQWGCGARELLPQSLADLQPLLLSALTERSHEGNAKGVNVAAARQNASLSGHAACGVMQPPPTVARCNFQQTSVFLTESNSSLKTNVFWKMQDIVYPVLVF